MVAPSVAVIGGGPGGMFFCHALETRRQLKEQGGNADLSNLPAHVTCFERASAPGGVWRSERTFVSASHVQEEQKDAEAAPITTNMYEALWTNGPKESIEFVDYTFEEHFGGHPLPVYMPREPVLEYLVGRVTKNCPDFFEKYMKFNTSVESARYDESKSKFEIVTRDMITGKEAMEEFDKCIWAGGENGRPKMPAAILNMFLAGGFNGRIIHSSDSANFETDCRGKRVLLIGGSYSAEDLALMAIKVGAAKVYVSSRLNENAISWTRAWPLDIVEVLEEQIPVRVTENGKCIEFSSAEWAFPDDCVPGDEVTAAIRDIETIILCTGYSPNFDMLDKSLRQAVSKDASLKLSVPEGWKMKPNAFTGELGEVVPGDVRWINSPVSFPGLYRSLCIDNPDMMFITSDVDNPLHGIDVCCWMLLSFISGERQIPSKEEMRRQNEQDALIPMDNPYWRYWMDKNYFEAFNEKYKSKPNWESFPDHDDIYLRFLARAAQEADYPLSFGTFFELNEVAETILRYDSISYEHRAKLTAEDAKLRRTFRDCSNDSDEFCSLFSGAKAVPLKSLWLDIDAHDTSIVKA